MIDRRIFDISKRFRCRAFWYCWFVCGMGRVCYDDDDSSGMDYYDSSSSSWSLGKIDR